MSILVGPGSILDMCSKTKRKNLWRYSSIEEDTSSRSNLCSTFTNSSNTKHNVSDVHILASLVECWERMRVSLSFELLFSIQSLTSLFVLRMTRMPLRKLPVGIRQLHNVVVAPLLRPGIDEGIQVTRKLCVSTFFLFVPGILGFIGYYIYLIIVLKDPDAFASLVVSMFLGMTLLINSITSYLLARKRKHISNKSMSVSLFCYALSFIATALVEPFAAHRFLLACTMIMACIVQASYPLALFSLCIAGQLVTCYNIAFWPFTGRNPSHSQYESYPRLAIPGTRELLPPWEHFVHNLTGTTFALVVALAVYIQSRTMTDLLNRRGKTIEVAKTVCQMLRDYDVDGVTTVLEQQTLGADPQLVHELVELNSNLQRYRPFLPNFLFLAPEPGSDSGVSFSMPMPEGANGLVAEGGRLPHLSGSTGNLTGREADASQTSAISAVNPLISFPSPVHQTAQSPIGRSSIGQGTTIHFTPQALSLHIHRRDSDLSSLTFQSNVSTPSNIMASISDRDQIGADLPINAPNLRTRRFSGSVRRHSSLPDGSRLMETIDSKKVSGAQFVGVISYALIDFTAIAISGIDAHVVDFTEAVYAIAEEAKASVHSMHGDTVQVSWNATHRVIQPAVKAVQFLLRLAHHAQDNGYKIAGAIWSGPATCFYVNSANKHQALLTSLPWMEALSAMFSIARRYSTLLVDESTFNATSMNFEYRGVDQVHFYRTHDTGFVAGISARLLCENNGKLPPDQSRSSGSGASSGFGRSASPLFAPAQSGSSGAPPLGPRGQIAPARSKIYELLREHDGTHENTLEWMYQLADQTANSASSAVISSALDEACLGHFDQALAKLEELTFSRRDHQGTSTSTHSVVSLADEQIYQPTIAVTSSRRPSQTESLEREHPFLDSPESAHPLHPPTTAILTKGSTDAALTPGASSLVERLRLFCQQSITPASVLRSPNYLGSTLSVEGDKSKLFYSRIEV